MVADLRCRWEAPPLLRLPDLTMPMLYVHGFPSDGHAESSGLFRPKQMEVLSTHDIRDGFLGANAIAFIDEASSFFVTRIKILRTR